MVASNGKHLFDFRGALISTPACPTDEPFYYHNRDLDIFRCAHPNQLFMGLVPACGRGEYEHLKPRFSDRYLS